MKFSWRTEWPLWLLLAAMFVLAAVTWPHAPDRIPTHWGTDGKVNGYGGKFEGLVLIPLISLILYALFLVLPKFDPLRVNYATFAGAYTVLRFAILLFMAILYGVIHLWIRGRETPIPVLIPILVGALLLVMGGIMGRLRPNWFVGIRTPWTLSSKRAWHETHRAARWVFSGAGLALIATGFLASTAVLIATLVLMTFGILCLVIYSYLLWRDDPERVPPPSSLHAD
ncbi:MAG TPA: SdpI family protein [Candidatus Polarisedimenticolia bacterium]|nr:SdpI family protein [Candidatus Polarisedimenticolia bacterium]